MDDEIAKVIFDSQQIKTRVEELGSQISKDFAGEELVVISIINGALLFTADLIRTIEIPVKLDCIRARSSFSVYTDRSSPKIIDTLRLDISNQNVLVVDDVVDTGNTLSQVVKQLNLLQAKKVKTCVLLHKNPSTPSSFACDYVGFHIEQDFAVGYGLDFAERYRYLPYIGVLRPDLLNPPEWA